MRYNFVLPSLVFASSVLSAYVPSEPWSTLTPKEPAPSGASTDYTHPFGIQIVTVSASASAAKRDVEQIGDGQVQANSKPVQTTAATVVQQIGDGQIQHQTTAATVVQQIGDGQIQHQTTAAPVVQQIGDGQIQHQTVSGVVQQIGDGQIQHQTTVSGVVQQIGDGQVQHQTVSGVVQQIGDGQIQHQTTTLVTVVQQTSDGQVQHVTSTLTTVAAASQAGDGQVQNTATPDNDNAVLEACSTKNSLSMTIKGGELRDSKGRIGAIVANRQFQFDGPPPQAGSIYAGGWSVTKDGYLALGDSTEFYQCQSGDFYNLYDKNVAAQCGPVKLAVVDLVSC